MVLTCGEFPTGGEWRSCQVGNDRSDSRTTASKFHTSHPNVDLLYKSQPFTEEMESWPTQKWGIAEKRLRTPDSARFIQSKNNCLKIQSNISHELIAENFQKILVYWRYHSFNVLRSTLYFISSKKRKLTRVLKFQLNINLVCFYIMQFTGMNVKQVTVHVYLYCKSLEIFLHISYKHCM